MKGNEVFQKIRSGYKAVTVFVLGLGGFLTATNADPEFAAALPQGAAQWLTMVGIPFVLAAGAWLKRNEVTIEEAEKALERAKRAGV